MLLDEVIRPSRRDDSHVSGIERDESTAPDYKRSNLIGRLPCSVRVSVYRHFNENHYSVGVLDFGLGVSQRLLDLLLDFSRDLRRIRLGLRLLQALILGLELVDV